MTDYKRTLEKKLDGLIDKWEEIIDTNPGNQGVDMITKFLTRNNKYKLPWAMWEACEAVKQTQKLIDTE